MDVDDAYERATVTNYVTSGPALQTNRIIMQRGIVKRADTADEWIPKLMEPTRESRYYSLADDVIAQPLNLRALVLDVDNDVVHAYGYGVTQQEGVVRPMRFYRRNLGAHDVLVKIEYASVCHSDLHSIMGEWPATYPLIPGHEMVGVVIAADKTVTRFHVGDIVGVGVIVDACMRCEECVAEREQYCLLGAVNTYDSDEVDYDAYYEERGRGVQQPELPKNGRRTYGGYSNAIVINEHYCHAIPANLDISRCAPLLCAGITTYNPLKQMEVQGKTVGIAGIGGLGHMAVMLARVLGAARVVGLTTSAWKMDSIVRELGADAAVLVSDYTQMEPLNRTFDCILSTIPVPHDYNVYLRLLKTMGKLWVVGDLFATAINPITELMGHNASIHSSNTGGMALVDELLTLCSRRSIMPIVEYIAPNQLTNVRNALKTSQVSYRYVFRP